MLSALPPSEEDHELSLLCPVRALRIYSERSASFRRMKQLFVNFANRSKGHPVTKKRLSKSVVLKNIFPPGRSMIQVQVSRAARI